MEEKSIKKIDHITFILFLILLLCSIFSFFNVKAVTHEWDVTNTIWSTSDCEITQTHLGYYCAADSNVTNDLWSKIQVGNNAAGNNVLSISFLVKTSMLANSNHTIELHGLRYNNVTYSCSSNVVNCSVSYVSTSQLNINFTSSANGISSAGVGFTITAYPNSFNGNNIFYINQFKLLSTEIVNSGGGSSSSGFDDTGIISNANQNTTEIINNQNENTQQVTSKITDLMNAQNLIAADDLQQQRTQLESMCKNSYSVSLTKGGVISGTSVVANSQGFYSDYINVGLRGQTITRICVANTYQGNTPNQYLIFYDSNKNVLQTNYSNVACRNLPSGTQYFRVGTYYPGIVITARDYCITADDQVYNAMTDDSIENGTGNDFFNNFSTTDNGGISTIVTKPLVLINSLLSNNSSCNDLTFSVAFPNITSRNVTFPSGCILWNNVPSATITIYQTIVCGFASYLILKKLFKDIENLKSPDDDRVDVVDL